MRRVLALLLACSMFSQSVLAQCPNAVTLHVGDTVKDCDRVGLSVPFEKNVRADLVQGDYNKKALVEQQKIIDLKTSYADLSDKQVTLWKTEAENKNKELQDERNRSKWEFWGGMAGGALLIILSSVVVKNAAR